MGRVNVNWEVSVLRGNHSFSYEDLNVQSKEEWDSLSKEEQREKLQDALNGMPDETYMVVDNWD